MADIADEILDFLSGRDADEIRDILSNLQKAAHENAREKRSTVDDLRQQLGKLPTDELRAYVGEVRSTDGVYSELYRQSYGVLRQRLTAEEQARRTPPPAQPVETPPPPPPKPDMSKRWYQLSGKDRVTQQLYKSGYYQEQPPTPPAQPKGGEDE